MNFAAVFHRAQAPWSYALNADELVLRLQTGPEVERVFLHWGDPFEAGILGGAERWHGQCRELTDPQPLDHALWWTAVIRPPYKRCRYHFELHSGGQVWLYGEDGFCTPDRQDGTHPAGFYQPWMNPADIPAPPAWVRDTVWYQIFPDRFCRSKGSANQTPWREGPVTNRERFGGDLPGICEKLDYLASLGVSGLYLNPIFAADSAHRYDTRDYTRVDPDLGTNADLKQLVEQAHTRGIRVMLDAVFNHCGPHFAPWRDVMEKGPDSPYWDWFMVNRWPPEAAPGGTRDGRYFSFAFAFFLTGLYMRPYAQSLFRSHLVRTIGVSGVVFGLLLIGWDASCTVYLTPGVTWKNLLTEPQAAPGRLLVEIYRYATGLSGSLFVMGLGNCLLLRGHAAALLQWMGRYTLGAYIMHIAFHRCKNNFSGFCRSSLRLFRFDCRLQQTDSLFHCSRAFDNLRQEHLSRTKQFAYFVHSCHQRLINDIDSPRIFLKRFAYIFFKIIAHAFHQRKHDTFIHRQIPPFILLL